METMDADGQSQGAPVPPSGLSPALRARAEAGWRRFLDRWSEVREEPEANPMGPVEALNRRQWE